MPEHSIITYPISQNTVVSNIDV